MAIYSFICLGCKKEFDLICKWEDIGSTVCTECLSKVEKKITAPAGHRYYGGADKGFHRTNIKADL